MSIRLLAALMLLLSAPAVARAEQMFRWVDDQGVTHFSQWPTQDSAQEVTARELPSRNAPDYDPLDDPNSVLEQAERIHAHWRALREERAKKEPSPAEPIPAYDPRHASRIRWERRITYPIYACMREHYRPVRGGKLRRRQLAVLDELGRLDGPRAYSINSSLHRARVEASSRIPFRQTTPPK